LEHLSEQQQLEQIVQQYEPAIRKAFLEARETIRSDAVNALPIDSTAFKPVADEIRETFIVDGLTAVSKLLHGVKVLPVMRSSFGFCTRNRLARVRINIVVIDITEIA